ncbi:MAG: hypothetical protein AAGI27_11465 [Pseudomonadota bacterium]
MATDERYAQRQATQDLFINRTDLCDYAGGYVDGKIISRDYLERVAQHGNEPSRAAFQGAFLGFSHDERIADTLAQIPVYPDAGHEDRLRAFYSMAFVQNWLIHEADRHGNAYTILRAASQLSLFAGRLVLAHNRELFPYHKWLPTALRSVPDKPERFIEDFERLVSEPTAANAKALFERLCAFRDWGVSDIEAYTWFMTDVENAWMTDSTPLEDL